MSWGQGGELAAVDVNTMDKYGSKVLHTTSSVRNEKQLD